MNERGMALVVTMFTLAAIGALITGTFVLGGLEQQMARTGMYAVQAGEAAEAGLVNALRISPARYASIGEGAEAVLEDRAVVSPDISSVRYTASVRRLTSVLFLVRSIGERLGPDGRVLAADGRGMLLRLAASPVLVPVGEVGSEMGEEVAVVRPVHRRAWMPLY